MILGIIQARMGSTRFPGKVLALVCGIPLIDLVLCRVIKSKLVNEWVIATTKEKRDDVLDRGYMSQPDGGHCRRRAFHGPTENVLARFYLCAREHHLEPADIIVRVTADDPLKDPKLIDQVVGELLQDSALDYCSNTIKPTYPLGLDVEAFRFRALERAYWEARSDYDLEHVTPYIQRNTDLFNVSNITNGEDLHHVRWTIDTTADLLRMNGLLAGHDPVTVNWRALVGIPARR